MYNNAIIGNRGAASTGGAAVDVSNNYVAASGGASPFLDAASGNFHPAAGGPLVGAGKNLTAISGPFDDASGAPRPVTGPWTVGAYER